MFWKSICIGQVKTAKDQPTLQKTVFGWVVAGITPNKFNNNSNQYSCNIAVDHDLVTSLNRFWEIEHGLTLNNSSPEQRECKKHYTTTVNRNIDGRFIVRLPIKQDIFNKIGDTKGIAHNCLISLKKRLQKTPNIKKQYVAIRHIFKKKPP